MRFILKCCSEYMVIAFTAMVLFPIYTGLGRESHAESMNPKILVVFHPFKTATLSAEVSGVVMKTPYEMGAQFKTDTPLIDLNPAIYLAEKQKMDALLSFAATALETNTNLYQRQSISEIEFAKTKADLTVARTNVALAKHRLAACSVRAPYPGRVVKLLVNENEWIEQGQPLIEIVDDRMMRAKFYIPSNFYRRIRIGQKLKVLVSGIQKRVKSQITHISPVLESNSATFQVFAEIDNSQHLLRAGMVGEIILKLPKGK